MNLRFPLPVALAILASLVAVTAPDSCQAQADDALRALDGEWVFVEDRTEGRAEGDRQPSMSSRVTFRVDDDALTLVRSDVEIRMPLDGAPVDIEMEGRVSQYRGEWKNGAFTYESTPAAGSSGALIRWELRPTDEGLLASAAVNPPTGFSSVALYRHPADIALPEPAKATISDLAWLAGAWTGTRGSKGQTSIEERWSPPLGGAMLAVSRTVTRERMVAFEFLRIVEREGGLVYVAQPNGGARTDFALTAFEGTRAVFENPRHDFPQRITYELSPEGNLTASIGYINGGRPQGFAFKREVK